MKTIKSYLQKYLLSALTERGIGVGLLLFLALPIYAQDQVVTETTVQGENTYVTHYLYDAQARPFLLLTDELSMQFYTYDETGNVVKQEYSDFTNPNLDRTYTYTYNEAGLVATEEEFAGERSLSSTAYTYDDHGHVTARTVNNAGGALIISTRNTYDEAGKLVKVETLYPLDPSIVMSSTEYYYDGEFVVKTISFSREEVTSIVENTYNEAGLLIKSVTSVPVVSEEETEEEQEVVFEISSTTTYTYADIDVSFAPLNVQAVAGEGNTIVVTWEGTANSIVLDGKFYTVTGNTFTTPVLIDGTYTVYVINNGNATAAEALDVVDDTKVGVSDVHLDGEVSASIVLEENRDGEMVPVTYYNIPVAWTLPAGAKPIGYRIYYNEQYYVEVEDGTLRSYVIPAKNITNWSMATMSVITLPFVVRVVAIYETGEMEPANLLELDTEAILALSVQATQAAAAPTEVYTLSGVRLPSQNNLRPGTYVFRNGKVARKVQTR